MEEFYDVKLVMETESGLMRGCGSSSDALMENDGGLMERCAFNSERKIQTSAFIKILDCSYTQAY